MDDFKDSNKLVSVYNEAGLQIMRLNNLWIDCHDCVKDGDLVKYKWKLDRAWIELSADAVKLDKKYYFEAIKMFNDAISKSKNNDSLYQLLQKKEIFLKELQEEAGKGSKRKEKDSEWF